MRLSSALDIYYSSKSRLNEACGAVRYYLKRNLNRIETGANVCFVAIWPWITPGDVQTNIQQLHTLTNGEYTIRAAIKGMQTIPTLIQAYLSNTRNLF